MKKDGAARRRASPEDLRHVEAHMRLYLKLLPMIAVFACATHSHFRQATSDLAYDARVAFVCAFGSTSDYEALIEDTQRMLAQEHGNLDLYLKGQRYRDLIAQRVADAARLNVVPLTEDDFQRILTECMIEAFGPAGESADGQRERNRWPSAR